MNLEILVEERSAERALRALLPRIVPNIAFEILVFQGKPDLLRKLPNRLKGCATWIAHANTSLVVLVDRDDDDCCYRDRATHECGRQPFPELAGVSRRRATTRGWRR